MKPDPEKRAYEVVEMDDDHVKAVAFNMLFMVWRRRTLVEPYRRGLKLAQKLAADSGVTVGVCQVVEVESIPPDAATRAAFVDFLRAPEVGHFSVTHDGAGFKAASVRAVVAGVHALARPKCAHSVHHRVTDAARWHASMQAKLGRNDQAPLIESIVGSLRELHRQRYP